MSKRLSWVESRKTKRCESQVLSRHCSELSSKGSMLTELDRELKLVCEVDLFGRNFIMPLNNRSARSKSNTPNLSWKHLLLKKDCQKHKRIKF